MVVSGAPDRTKYHAIHICDMALDIWRDSGICYLSLLLNELLCVL